VCACEKAAAECVRACRLAQAFIDGTNLLHTVTIVTWSELLRSNHSPRGTTIKVIVYELPPSYLDGWTALYSIAGIRELVIFLAKALNVFSPPPSTVGLARRIPRVVEISSDEEEE